MKSNRSKEEIHLHKTISRRYEIKPIDRVIKTTFSEKCGAAAVRLPPAKRKE
jgi:RNase P subunit RPR2